MKGHIENRVKNRVKGEARKRVQSRKASIDKNGKEILDETPLFVEVGQKPTESMDQKIRRITAQVQAETAAKFAAKNMSEEDVQRVLDEEDNFDIPDDFENQLTVYEAQGALADLEETVTIQTEEAGGVSGREEPSTETSSPPAEQSSEAAPVEATQ